MIQQTALIRQKTILLFLLCFCSSGLTLAAEPAHFRIGTGGSAGTYFPIGSLISVAIADEISTAEGEGRSLIMLAQRSNGSEANAREIGAGLLESGFVQADVAHWAYHGTGPFLEQERIHNISAIASLYLESVHLVARAGSEISSVEDLAGKRVSVDEIGSGTQLDVGAILNAFSMSESDVETVYLKTADAISRLRDDKLDAFFIIAGYPVSGVAKLLEDGIAALVPIDGAGVQNMLENHPFFTPSIVPSGTYANTHELATVAVAAQWLVDSQLEEQLIHDLTSALWSEHARKVLNQGHPKGRELDLDTALLGISIPLHPGAARFYQEAGLELPEIVEPTMDTQ